MGDLTSRLHRFDLSLTNDECRSIIAFYAADVDPAGLEYVTPKARAILKVYPRDDVNDPQAYVTAIAAIMSMYPHGVIDRITDPRTGVVGRIKFLPRPAEIKEACDEEIKRRERLRKNAELIIWRHDYEATEGKKN